jgi:hypothetical protein
LNNQRQYMDPDLSNVPQNKFPVRVQVVDENGEQVTEFGGGSGTIPNPLPITASSLPLPTGAATAANQVTANSSLATIATLSKAEDSAHASGDTGIPTWGVANEAQTVLVADGDYVGQARDTRGNTLVTGNVASGATDSGRGVKVSGVYKSTRDTFTDGQRADFQTDTRGNLAITLFANNSPNGISAVATNADGQATTSTTSRLEVVARNSVLNGSGTFDRQISATNGLNSTGGGIATAGLVAQLDDTSPTSITENQFGLLRMTDRRELRTAALGGSTSSVTSVADTATSTTLIALSSSLTRREVIIENTSSARLYIKFGTTASSTDFTMSLAQNEKIVTEYQGRIDGIWATDPGDGAAKVTEVTG